MNSVGDCLMQNYKLKSVLYNMRRGQIIPKAFFIFFVHWKITYYRYEAVKLCRKTCKQLSCCLMNRRISWHEGLYVHGIISKCIVYLDNMTALSKITMTRKWLFAFVNLCRCRRSSSSPLKHHILSRSNVSSRKPFSYKLTLFEAYERNPTNKSKFARSFQSRRHPS